MADLDDLTQFTFTGLESAIIADTVDVGSDLDAVGVRVPVTITARPEVFLLQTTPARTIRVRPVKVRIEDGVLVLPAGVDGDIRLVANTDVLGITGQLLYDVKFGTGFIAGDEIDFSDQNFTFVAPTSDTSVDMSEVERVDGHTPSGTALRMIPDHVRLNDAGDVVFSANGIDIPDPLDLVVTPVDSDVVDDTSPQLGGDLDLNGHTVGAATAADLTKLHAVTADATELSYLDGVTSGVQAQLNAKQAALGFTAENVANKNQANGYAGLDGGGKVLIENLPASLMQYQGTWNVATNTPTLADGAGSIGDVYKVAGAGGTRNLGSGNIEFAIGDYAILNASLVWEKSDTTDAVASVAGKTGNVTLDKADVGLGNVDNVQQQPLDADLTAIAALTTTPFGRAQLTNADAAAARAAIGAVGSALVDAKGDLFVGTANDTVGRLAVGTDGNALLADSTQTAGVKWGTVATSANFPIRFTAAVALVGATPSDRAYALRTLTGARMRTAAAPVGSALVAQVQHWGGSSWSTIGTCTIADGSVVEDVQTFSQAQVVGNMLRLNVTSVGSTTPANGVVVDVLWS